MPENYGAAFRQDCAGTAVFLASDAASYITGQVLVADGGLTLPQIGKL